MQCKHLSLYVRSALAQSLHTGHVTDADSSTPTTQPTDTSHVAQSCYSVIGDKPFLWSKPKFDPP